MLSKVTVVFARGVSVMHTSAGPQPGRCSAESGLRSRVEAPLPSAVGKGMLVGAGHQSAQRDNFRVRFTIEVHDGGVGSVEVPEHADAAAKADALACSELALTTALQGLVHLVCLPLIWIEAYDRPILSVALRDRHG